MAICGASAALAIASVIPGNKESERDLFFTVVSVTMLSTVAMILYPIVFSLAGLTDLQSGMVGATIYDVAQVVGAGYSISTEAGDAATIIKLMRVFMLPFVLVVIAVVATNTNDRSTLLQIPAFVIGFAVVAAIIRLNVIPPAVSVAATSLSSWLVVAAISALGVRTNIASMMRPGWQHLAIMVAQTLAPLTMAYMVVRTGLLE